MAKFYLSEGSRIKFLNNSKIKINLGKPPPPFNKLRENDVKRRDWGGIFLLLDFLGN